MFHVNTYASVTKVSIIKEDLMMKMGPYRTQIGSHKTPMRLDRTQMGRIEPKWASLSARSTCNLRRVSFMSHLLAPPPSRAVPSPWLALWYGMVSHWLSGHLSNLKQHYSAALGLGALLSSPLEEALY